MIDPLERLEVQIDAQYALIDKDDTYPCCECGERKDINEMMTVSAHPASPLACHDCLKKFGWGD